MRRVLYIASVLVFGLVPTTVDAHHAFAAEFSTTSPLTLSGKVVRMVWLNPHARFLMDVPDNKGGHAQWEMVLGSPNVLIRMGWEREFLKPGDQITVSGFRARDGSRMGSARTIRLPGGRTANFGAAFDGGPER